jgi:hypothetical protein
MDAPQERHAACVIRRPVEGVKRRFERVSAITFQFAAYPSSRSPASACFFGVLAAGERAFLIVQLYHIFRRACPSDLALRARARGRASRHFMVAFTRQAQGPLSPSSLLPRTRKSRCDQQAKGTHIPRRPVPCLTPRRCRPERFPPRRSLGEGGLSFTTECSASPCCPGMPAAAPSPCLIPLASPRVGDLDSNQD